MAHSRHSNLRISLLLIPILGIISLACWILYPLSGYGLVISMYEGNAPDFLSGIIVGQNVWPIEYYLGKADSIFLRFHIILFTLAVLLIGFLELFYLYRKKAYIRCALVSYAALSLIVGHYVFTIIHFKGIEEGLKHVLIQGSISNLDLTVIYVIISWLLVGSVLLLLNRKVINRNNFIPYAGFYIIAFIYLNFLRERLLYGDVQVYVEAAFNLFNNETLHPRYLYPPMWAAILEPFVPLGGTFIERLCMVLNYFSLLLFYALLVKTLIRYGFSSNLASLLTFVILVVNVPVLRTLGYVQVNIHVINLILLSLLYFEKNFIISALALSLAINLKSSPVVLLLPFILTRQWKWLISFVIITVLITFFILTIHGADCYTNFITNVFNLYRPTEGHTAFRNNSIASFVQATYWAFNVNFASERSVTSLIQVILLVLSLWFMYASAKKRVYTDNENPTGFIFNSYIILLFLMMMLSPKIWQHHGVFIIFPFLVLFKRISKPSEVILYSLAWYLFFLMPTIDFYPFGFKMIFGAVCCYFLFSSFLRHDKSKPDWFENLIHSIDEIFFPSQEVPAQVDQDNSQT